MLDSSHHEQTNFSVSAAGPLRPLPCVNPDTVVGHTYSELRELFENLAPPSLEGNVRLRGTILTLAGTSWMPRQIRRFIARLLWWVLPWSAKEFHGTYGSNIWFGLRRGRRFLHYDVSRQNGTDGKPVTWLDYNVERNWAIFRRIRGEMRLLGPGLLLCRMQWKTGSGYFTVMYFALSGNE